jgi:nucleolar MIF4G domain-containing protein 1
VPSNQASQEPKTPSEVKRPVNKTALEKLISKSNPNSRRTQREKEEDAYIKYLETKLGYKNGKSAKVDDGLDGMSY